jgi:hypothetical protein
MIRGSETWTREMMLGMIEVLDEQLKFERRRVMELTMKNHSLIAALNALQPVADSNSSDE